MHGVMRSVRNPRLLVDHRQPPAAKPRAGDMIEPRHRTIVDVEHEALVRLMAERKPDRRLDGAAMGDGDHVAAGVFDVDAFDRAAHAVVEVHETFAARRRLVDRSEPRAAARPAGEECRAVHALPFPEMLFGEIGLMRHRRGPGKSGGPDRIRGLMRAFQIARDPNRAPRQDLSDRFEHHAVAGVAAEVLLPVDAPLILANWRVAHPPPPCRYNSA